MMSEKKSNYVHPLIHRLLTLESTPQMHHWNAPIHFSTMLNAFIILLNLPPYVIAIKYER